MCLLKTGMMSNPLRLIPSVSSVYRTCWCIQESDMSLVATEGWQRFCVGGQRLLGKQEESRNLVWSRGTETLTSSAR